MNIYQIYSSLLTNIYYPLLFIPKIIYLTFNKTRTSFVVIKIYDIMKK
ncbi:hypothetical protein CLCAR_2501 [Clostridium carboxidivorans P7]|nr:hypothetical protein CLCAR_2501 [Clostridium carboxidivorans P7]